MREDFRRNPLIRRPYYALRHVGLGDDDAILLSYPKSGNTWLKFLLIHLATGTPAGFEASDRAVPYVGLHARAPNLLASGGRLIKSHEPFSRLYSSRYRRVILLVRDGRDVAVSYYHAMVRRGRWDGDLSRFLPAFLRGEVGGYGPWDEHVDHWLDFLERRPDCFTMVRYEDLLDHPVEELGGVARFVGLADDRARLEEALAANAMASMREREAASRRYASFPGTGHIVREGVAGGWRRAFSEAEAERFRHAAGRTLARLGYVSSDAL